MKKQFLFLLIAFVGVVVTACQKADFENPSNNQIFYTTSDGFEIIDYNCVFDANVVSHNYKNGMGVFKFDKDVTSVIFGEQPSLTSVSLPNSVTIIGAQAFYYCFDLADVKMSNNIITIKQRAFGSCAIEKITLPSTVTEIEERAFGNCRSLKEVYCKATTPPSLGEMVFTKNASDRKIYVPRESVEAYKSADSWWEYADCIVGYDF